VHSAAYVNAVESKYIAALGNDSAGPSDCPEPKSAEKAASGDEEESQGADDYNGSFHINPPGVDSAATQEVFCFLPASTDLV
jgi:hypothetical protein